MLSFQASVTLVAAKPEQLRCPTARRNKEKQNQDSNAPNEPVLLLLCTSYRISTQKACQRANLGKCVFWKRVAHFWTTGVRPRFCIIQCFRAEIKSLDRSSFAMPQLAAVRAVRPKNLKTEVVLKTSRGWQIARNEQFRPNQLKLIIYMNEAAESGNIQNTVRKLFRPPILSALDLPPAV